MNHSSNILTNACMYVKSDKLLNYVHRSRPLVTNHLLHHGIRNKWPAIEILKKKIVFLTRFKSFMKSKDGMK